MIILLSRRIRFSLFNYWLTDVFYLYKCSMRKIKALPYNKCIQSHIKREGLGEQLFVGLPEKGPQRNQAPQA